LKLVEKIMIRRLAPEVFKTSMRVWYLAVSDSTMIFEASEEFDQSGFGGLHIIAHTTRIPDILLNVTLDFAITDTEHEGQSLRAGTTIDFFLEEIDLLTNCNSAWRLCVVTYIISLIQGGRKVCNTVPLPYFRWVGEYRIFLSPRRRCTN